MSGTSINCICATNPDCQSPVAFLELNSSRINCATFTASNIMPHMVKGCYLIDSLLLSTLECLYSECCLSALYYHANVSYTLINTDVLWFHAHPLTYDQTPTRFPPNMTVGMILKKMMIEEWKPSSSFDRYFEACGPTRCTYSDITDTKNFVGIVITLISTISGLTAALRLTTPTLVWLTFYLFEFKSKKKPEGNCN